MAKSKRRRSPEKERIYNAKKYAANKPLYQAKSRKWAKANPAKAREIARKWRADHPEKYRASQRKHQYGINGVAWDAMFEQQDRACAICRSPTSGWKHHWHTDHLHGTKIVRGILCHACNALLGKAKDDPAILRAAIGYLARHADQ